MAQRPLPAVESSPEPTLTTRGGRTAASSLDAEEVSLRWVLSSFYAFDHFESLDLSGFTIVFIVGFYQ